jgi:hypothetical protein
MRNAELVLIKIKNIEVNGSTEETLWAKPLGQDLFEIRSLPKFVENINARDIVRAIASDSDSQPLVQKTVSRSGHKTIRFLFLKSSGLNREDILRRLKALGATLEEVSRGYWAADVDAEGNYQKICNYLSSLSVKGILECELDVGMKGLMQAWTYQDEP